MTHPFSLSRHLQTTWAKLTEPTLVRRSVVSVLLAFVLVWAVLLARRCMHSAMRRGSRCIPRLS